MESQAMRAPREGEGWILFAGVMLLTSGIFKIFDALWAFKYDDEVSDQVQTIFFERDLASYGWLWLFVGIVLIAAGVAVIGGAQWARWIGIIAASVAMIAYFPWIYFQPFWAMISMTMAFLVIYGLAVYGGEPVEG
jgi:hypothetical protein